MARAKAPATDPRWTAAQKALGAVLVWDESGRRMLLCCNDQQEQLTVWQLTDATWQLVARATGPSSYVPLVAAHDTSAKQLRIIAATLRESWSLVGASLTRQIHESPFGSAEIYAESACWDSQEARLLVSAGKVYRLDGTVWQAVPSTPMAASFLIDDPARGLVAFNRQGKGARVTGGTAGEVTLPLELPLVKAVARGDDSILVVTSASKGELRVIRDGKVVKKTAVPEGVAAAAWHPERGVYIVRVMATKGAITYAYAPAKGVLTELAGPVAN